ncbi:MAG: hypothetical protein FWD05_03525 [Oscillospiraceae bacterium]|nr:hypothetical protein [Oscillospiraceae bacterium]
MNTLRLKPAMRYQLNYMFWASLIAFAIAIAVLVLLTLLVGVTSYTDSVEIVNELLTDGDSIVVDDVRVIIDIGSIQMDFEATPGVFFNIAGVFAMMLFIIGIGGVREDLRFFLQHGLSRKTTLISSIIVSLAIGITYTLIIELVYLAFSSFNFFPSSGIRPSMSGFFRRLPAQALMYFFAWQFGSFISLLYYRMNKAAKIIFSITAGAIILLAVPRIFAIPGIIGTIISLALSFDIASAFAAGTTANVLGTTLLLLALSAVCIIGNFLLIRRAPIKEFS